ncbi:MAG: efflux RND transporter permease subunit, partial [Myxococcota bacterium]
MRIVDFSLRRRVTVAMCAVAVVLFGLVAFTRLEVSLLPELSYPSVTIETELPGAAPAEVEQLLTRPIEERIGVVSGVQRVVSVSRPGLSQVTVELGWDRDMDFAAIDLREKIELLRLPAEAKPPTLVRFDPGADPIVRLALAGGQDLHQLRDVAEQVVEKDLEGLAGVAAIEVSGGYEDEVEVVVDQGRLTAMELTIQQVADGLAKANVDQAGGSLYEREARYLVRAHNRLVGTAEIRDTVIVNREGRRVTVGDVATVRRTHRQRETITRLAGGEGVQLAIYKEGDANTTTVAAAVHERLELIEKRLPNGVELVVTADQSSFIVASVEEVLRSAVYGGVMAMIVLLLFLRDVRSTLIIATAIPISVIATFFLMYQTGTTLNVMSLGGLALGVGMLVDNAIVVLESIHRRREAGSDPREAARTGAGEVGQAVVASTLTTVAVFVPVVFLDGVAAQLFSDMAVTVCFSLLASLAVSLTLIPALATPLRGAESQGSSSVVTRVVAWPILVVRLALAGLTDVVSFVARPFAFVFDALLGRLQRRYPLAVRGAIRRPLTVLGIAALMFAGTVSVVPRLGMDLLPPLSQSEFELTFDLDEGRSLSATDSVAREVVASMADEPTIEQITSTVGREALGRGAGSQGEHVGAIAVRMKPGSTPADEAKAIERLRTALQRPEVRRVRLDRPTIFSVRRPLEIELYGDEPEALHRVGAEVRDAVARVPGITGARTSTEAGHPELEVVFDRERLATHNLDVAGVAATVRHQLQGEVA